MFFNLPKKNIKVPFVLFYPTQHTLRIEKTTYKAAVRSFNTTIYDPSNLLFFSRIKCHGAPVKANNALCYIPKITRTPRYTIINPRKRSKSRDSGDKSRSVGRRVANEITKERERGGNNDAWMLLYDTSNHKFEEETHSFGFQMSPEIRKRSGEARAFAR